MKKLINFLVEKTLQVKRHYTEIISIIPIDRINNEDYICDYSSMKLSLLAHLDMWDDLYELAKSQTQINPDDWTPWKKLIETSLKDIQR